MAPSTLSNAYFSRFGDFCVHDDNDNDNDNDNDDRTDYFAPCACTQGKNRHRLNQLSVHYKITYLELIYHGPSVPKFMRNKMDVLARQNTSTGERMHSPGEYNSNSCTGEKAMETYFWLIK